MKHILMVQQMVWISLPAQNFTRVTWWHHEYNS